MKNKKTYTAPAILEDTTLDVGVQLLASSAVVTDDTEVRTTGQEIGGNFEHSWEI